MAAGDTSSSLELVVGEPKLEVELPSEGSMITFGTERKARFAASKIVACRPRLVPMESVYWKEHTHITQILATLE